MEEAFAGQVVKIWRLRQRAERLRIQAPLGDPEPGVLSAAENRSLGLYHSAVRELRKECLTLAEGLV